MINKLNTIIITIFHLTSLSICYSQVDLDKNNAWQTLPDWDKIFTNSVPYLYNNPYTQKFTDIIIVNPHGSKIYFKGDSYYTFKYNSQKNSSYSGKLNTLWKFIKAYSDVLTHVDNKTMTIDKYLKLTSPFFSEVMTEKSMKLFPFHDKLPENEFKGGFSFILKKELLSLVYQSATPYILLPEEEIRIYGVMQIDKYIIPMGIVRHNSVPIPHNYIPYDEKIKKLYKNPYGKKIKPFFSILEKVNGEYKLAFLPQEGRLSEFLIGFCREYISNVVEFAQLPLTTYNALPPISKYRMSVANDMKSGKLTYEQWKINNRKKK